MKNIFTVLCCCGAVLSAGSGGICKAMVHKDNFQEKKEIALKVKKEFEKKRDVYETPEGCDVWMKDAKKFDDPKLLEAISKIYDEGVRSNIANGIFPYSYLGDFPFGDNKSFLRSIPTDIYEKFCQFSCFLRCSGKHLLRYWNFYYVKTIVAGRVSRLLLIYQTLTHTKDDFYDSLKSIVDAFENPMEALRGEGYY